MTDWPIDRIDTHADDALGRFTSQYDGMDVLKGTARVWAGRVQALEDAAYELLTERWIDTAIGVQLDRLGRQFGEPRLARGDDAYRAAIKIRIGLNQGSGEPETVIFVMRQLLETAVYRERYPAGVLIETQNEPVTLEQQQGIVSVTPAGVSVAGVSTLHTGPTIRYGTQTMAGTETTVQPFIVELMQQSVLASRGTAAGGSTIAGVLPVLPPDTIRQSVRAGRIAAHGGTTVTQINPER